MGINEDGSAEVTDFQNGKGGNPDKGEDGKKKGGELKCAGAEEERESKKKMKSLAEDNPSALENDKEDSPKALAKAVDILMAENRKKILRMIDEEWDGKKDLSERARLMLKFAGIAELGALVIKNNFRNGWDAVEKKVNMNLIENQSAIDFLQDYTFDNIVGLTTDVSEKLVQQMKIAVLNQEPLDKIRERVMAVFNIGEDRAMAIAVTETNRAYNQGILIASKSAEAQGVKLVKKWRAHHDERTSDTCKALDGMTVDINDNFVSPDGSFNGQAPPAHVSCRSHLELFVKD
jgi:SPP1 gp7 family putative phage head morphogenesis protein